MATFGEKTEESQTACEFTDYLVKLEKARKITLFLNGDKNFFGAQMLVNKRHFRTWDAFLNASTEKTGVNSAVRFITTPVTGTRLDGLDDLQDKESYVAITRGQFKPIGYKTLFERHKQYLAGNVHRTSSILKIRPVEHSRIQVPGKIAQIPIHAIMINVFVNGKDFDAPFRIALSQKVQRKWELVMKEIGEHVNGILGRPKALYTVDGSRVITNSSDLEPGGMYVIVGSEPGGFQHYCYGCQANAKHPKKLPPIKKRRRRPKKTVEKENCSFDAKQPAKVEDISGDQEAQQGNTELAPVATSQGDLPLQTASGKIEKVSSSTLKVAEKTQSAPFNSVEEQPNYESPVQIIGKAAVDDSSGSPDSPSSPAFPDTVANVIEQSYPLQATDTEEETKQEMEEETEEAERMGEPEKEKEMVEEENDSSFKQETAAPSLWTKEVDSDGQLDQGDGNPESTYVQSAKESDKTLTENKDEPAADGHINEFLLDDKAEDGTNIDVKEERKDRNEPDSAPAVMDTNDSDASERADRNVQSAKENDDTLTENKDEPPADGNINEFLLEDKAEDETNTDVKEERKDRSKRDATPAAMDTNDASEQAEWIVKSAKGSDKTLAENKDEPAADGNRNEFLLDDKVQYETNADVEEEAKDHSEQDSTLAPMDTNDSDASEQAKRVSSDGLVHDKRSTPLGTSEVPVAKDPSELNTTQKSSSKTDIQPHR